MNFPERFERVLEQDRLILPNDKIFVACSGGPDSVALVRLLLQFKKKWKLRLGLLHFNHQLRGAEAKRDEKFVRTLAKKHGLKFILGSADVKQNAKNKKQSIEEAAREARYDFFQKSGATKIALGHHQNDQAETVLMRVLQGTGPRGLCGIRRRMKKGRVEYVRPLLDFSRAEILAYLKSRKISFRKDTSNQSPRFFRNRLRSRLIPFLEKEFNPQVVTALARLGSNAQFETEFQTQLETEACQKVIKETREGRQVLRRRAFEKLPQPLQFRILDKIAKQIDPAAGLNFEAWRRIEPLLKRTGVKCSLPKNLELSLSRSTLLLSKRPQK